LCKYFLFIGVVMTYFRQQGKEKNKYSLAGFGSMFHKKFLISFNRETALVQWGTIFAGIAGRTTSFVFAWWVLKQTGSVSQFGTILSVTTGASTLFQLLAGALGDRLGAVNVMQRAAKAQFFLMIMLTAVVAYGRYSFAIALIINGMLAVSNALITGMNNPALAEVAPEGKLAEVMAQRGSLASVAKLIAPALAAMLLGAVSGAGAMFVTLFFSGAGLAMLIFVPRSKEEGTTGLTGRKSILGFTGTWLRDSIVGLRAFSLIRTDFFLCLVTCGINLGLPAYFVVLIPYYVVNIYKLPPSYLGIFDALFCLGMTCGGMATVGWLNKRVGKVNAITVSISVLTLMVVSIAFVRQPILFGAIQFIGGCFMLSIFANVGSLRALATPKAYRARIMSAASFMTSLSMGPGIALCTWVTHQYGGTTGVFSMACIIALSTAGIYLIPRARSFLAMSEESVRGAYEVVYPKAFQGN
jgi:DHA3 family macrolide efflux protein-like MFS transporter